MKISEEERQRLIEEYGFDPYVIDDSFPLSDKLAKLYGDKEKVKPADTSKSDE